MYHPRKSSILTPTGPEISNMTWLNSMPKIPSSLLLIFKISATNYIEMHNTSALFRDHFLTIVCCTNYVPVTLVSINLPSALGYSRECKPADVELWHHFSESYSAMLAVLLYKAISICVCHSKADLRLTQTENGSMHVVSLITWLDPIGFQVDAAKNVDAATNNSTTSWFLLKSRNYCKKNHSKLGDTRSHSREMESS